MKHKLILAMGMLMLASCSYNTSKGTADIQPPVVQRQWQADGHEGSDCSISTGMNSVQVYMRRMSGGLREAVYSSRDMDPGTAFVVRIGSNSYRTLKKYFSPQDSKKIIHDMLTEKEMYMEWNDSGSTERGERTSGMFYNMVPLAGFKEAYTHCHTLM